MMKKFIPLFVVLIILSSLFNCSFAEAGNQLPIELDGLAIQAQAHIDAGDVYLPLRAIGEMLGYTINWSGKDRKVFVSKGDVKIVIDLVNNNIAVNDHVYYMSGDYTGTSTNQGKIIGSTTYMGAGFFSGNLGLKVSLDKQSGKVLLGIKKENAITVKTIKSVLDNSDIKMTLQYPEIDGMKDESIQDTLNVKFKNAAEAAREEGKKNADDLSKVKAETGNTNKCETYFDYSVKYNQNGLLSLVFTDYQYAGGAHGSTLQTSQTFDLNTGRELELPDLFKSGAGYVALINRSVTGQIAERQKAGILPDGPLTPFESIDKDQEFYLSDNALVVYFQQYEYFPYAAGIQSFPVEYSDMVDLLKPDFGFLNAKTINLDPGKTNTMSVGDTGRVILKGNPTTGYTWHYTVDNPEVLTLESEREIRNSGMVGAGSTYSWSFKALKEGEATITFKYYRDWEGEGSATKENTVRYLVEVE